MYGMHVNMVPAVPDGFVLVALCNVNPGSSREAKLILRFPRTFANRC